MVFFNWLFNSVLGKAAAAATGLAVLLGAFTLHNANQRALGAARAIHKIEVSNDKAAKAGGRAAARAVDPGVRGERDPTTRDERAAGQSAARR